MSENAALVILSGGQDSTTCLFWAVQHFARVHAVTFDYGQSHAIELESAQTVARMAGVTDHEIIRTGRLLRSTSPLLDANTPLDTYTDFESMEREVGSRIEATFVPMRNAFFITLAANIAFSKGCSNLVTGVDEEDNANYPDCREAFVKAQEATINLALGLDGNAADAFHVLTPLIHKSKAETIALAQSLPGCMEAMAYTHTCYAGVFPPCGKCHSCVLRAHGFAEAGIEDPLITRARALAAEGR